MKANRTPLQWLDYIQALHPEDIALGLTRFDQVAFRLGLSQQAVGHCVITVAGTNGKGSTVAAIEALCLSAGVSVGAYTSPHLFDFGERLRLGGKASAVADWVPYFESIEAARTNLAHGPVVALTFFEYTTLAAMLMLRDARPQVWVMEIGLGGRLDAVNWLNPDLCIVTRIAEDHAQWLGTSLAAIAREKCGIFRANTPALFADPRPTPEVLTMVQNMAEQHRVSVLLQAGESMVPEPHSLSSQAVGDFGVRSEEERLVFYGQDGAGVGWERAVLLDDLPTEQTCFARLKAASRLNKDSWAAALQAVSLVLPQVHALSNTQWQPCWALTGLSGRFECLLPVGQVPWVMDVAHNLDATRLLVAKLKWAQVQQVDVVFGVLDDKPWQDMLGVLAPLARHWFVVMPDSPRAVPARLLADHLRDLGQSVTELSALAQADAALGCIKAVFNRPSEAQAVVVCGSFFSVGPFLAAFAAMKEAHE